MALILFCYSVGREVMKDIGAVINLLAELKENTIKIMKTRVCFVYTELEVSVHHFLLQVCPFAVIWTRNSNSNDDSNTGISRLTQSGHLNCPILSPLCTQSSALVYTVQHTPCIYEVPILAILTFALSKNLTASSEIFFVKNYFAFFVFNRQIQEKNNDI